MTPAPGRLISIEGTLNFRDLGGYEAVDGRVVAPGLVYRSDDFSKLTPQAVTYIESLGVTAVYDFRSDRELAINPNVLPHGVVQHRVPILSDGAQQTSLIELITSGVITKMGIEEMAELYREMLETASSQFGEVIAGIASSKGPVVFHCTAGKDRTGVAAALLLSTLGVDREQIVADYQLTDVYRTPHRIPVITEQFLAAGVDPEPFLALFSAPPAAIEAALDHLDANYGGAEAYLTGRAGVSAPAVELLHDRLLIPD